MKQFFMIGVLIAFTLAPMGCSKGNPQAAKVSSDPPKVGEAIDDVVHRLGAPVGSDIDAKRQTATYITSYTDQSGTIHHITVEDGVITRVLYTDSQ
jgi:predicted SpoU family rRNA methylase